MSKSTKTLIIIIGTITVLAGIVRYFQGNTIDAILAAIIGVSLIGTAYVAKPGSQKNN